MKRLLAAFTLISSAVAFTASLASSASDLAACVRASQQSKDAEGIALCTRAINDGSLNPTARVVAYSTRGNIHLRNGQFDEAVADFTEVIGLSPGSSGGYVQRALVYAQKGEIDRAFSDYNMAVRVNPRNPTAYVARGLAYLKAGNYDAAISDYNVALTASPSPADWHYGRGVAKIKSGNPSEGNADIAEAIKRDPRIAEKMARVGVTP